MSNIGTQAKPISRKDLRAFAGQVRAALGCAETPYVDAETLLDLLLPRGLPAFGYGIKSCDEMGDAHGLSTPDECFIWLRDDVYEGACAGNGRDRFTVIHEVGHLLLHTSDRIMLRRGLGKPKTYCDPEWQANCFAGEFLMPPELVRACTCAADVSQVFGTSYQAAEIQWDQFRKEGLLN